MTILYEFADKDTGFYIDCSIPKHIYREYEELMNDIVGCTLKECIDIVFQKLKNLIPENVIPENIIPFDDDMLTILAIEKIIQKQSKSIHVSKIVTDYLELIDIFMYIDIETEFKQREILILCADGNPFYGGQVGEFYLNSEGSSEFRVTKGLEL